MKIAADGAGRPAIRTEPGALQVARSHYDVAQGAVILFFKGHDEYKEFRVIPVNEPLLDDNERLIQVLIGDVRQAVPQAVALLRQTRATPAPELSFEQTLEFVETILVYRCPHWGREEIKAMLGLDTELKQTRFYQEVFAETTP
ncbi:MAG: DUF2887 domain-containing protein [Candidatus Competibacteraceae bacterium]